MRNRTAGLLKLALCSTLVLSFMAGGCTSTPRTPEEERDRSAIKAARDGRVPTLDRLLAEGVSANVADDNGDTLLHWAASRGHDAMVKSLIAKGAGVSTQNKAGNTPLHLAAEHNHPKCAQALIAAGAIQSTRNNDGKTAAEVAGSKVKPLLTP